MKSTRKIKKMTKINLKKMKSVKGFTLIELIVVIAIIGVLAVLLIPNMVGKVKNARQKTADDTAAKIAEQAIIVCAEMESGDKITGFGNKIYGYIAENSQNVEDLKNAAKGSNAEYFKIQMEKAIPELKDSLWVVKFDADCNLICVVYNDKKSNYVGTYPVNETIQKTFSLKGKNISMNDIGDIMKVH